ncbi:hypothetical protein C0583_02665 [Candidatus Parcubacteria bacterium]|nr:MAG: hypothetical protein C0583_02665 [Candidatus Parcubacteria bacterium]
MKIPKIFLFAVLIFSLGVLVSSASVFRDADIDGVPDKDEIEIYKTDTEKADTDDDNYSDWTELNNGYTPLDSRPLKLEESDFDGDGLSDRMELNFHTDLSNIDTDGDGLRDGIEIANFFDPLKKGTSSLEKRIEVNTGAQELSIFLGGVRMKTYTVSTGKPSMPTPKGHFTIYNKLPRPWSSAYGLWMPYWLGMNYGKFGIHELPEWPGGYKEGENHLGTPVSHGCIRLGVGEAEEVYNWTEVGTEVFIY